MSNREYGDPPTVEEVIQQLNKIKDKTLRVYFRPKYKGSVECWEEIPVNYNGISEMCDYNNEPDRVVFLV